MKKTNNFQIAKAQPQVLLSFCITFYRFQRVTLRLRHHQVSQVAVYIGPKL